MPVRTLSPSGGARRAAATVELALLAPLLVFLGVVAADYSRLFYHVQVVTNAARNGALYGCSDPTHAANTSGISAAALADCPDLSPAPTVTSTTGTDSDGNYVEVTVSWTFNTITSYPGIPSATTLTSTTRMRVSPVLPSFN